MSMGRITGTVAVVINPLGTANWLVCKMRRAADVAWMRMVCDVLGHPPMGDGEPCRCGAMFGDALVRPTR